MASALLTHLTRRRRQVETLRNKLQELELIAGELRRILEKDPNHYDAAQELELLEVRRDRIQKSVAEAESASSSR